MPVERVSMKEFGALSSIDVGPDSVIVLELAESYTWDYEAIERLRRMMVETFPDNQAIVLGAGLESLKIVDLPRPPLQVSLPTVAAAVAVTAASAFALRFARRWRRA